MTDLRDKVESDRGIIKMIQLVIPGYRGYRIKEDLRIADRLLREELANRLGVAEKGFEGARKAIAKRNAIDLIEDIGELVIRTHTAIDRLRHAEQGYTGISPDYRIKEAELNNMYEWDLRLLNLIEGLMKIANNLKDTARTMPEPDIALELTNAIQAIEDYETIFDQRREAFAGLTIG
ncbi:MAG: hypothetical protein R6W91_01220 [Thermoplasmata archaeon]